MVKATAIVFYPRLSCAYFATHTLALALCAAAASSPRALLSVPTLFGYSVGMLVCMGMARWFAQEATLTYAKPTTTTTTVATDGADDDDDAST